MLQLRSKFMCSICGILYMHGCYLFKWVFHLKFYALEEFQENGYWELLSFTKDLVSPDERWYNRVLLGFGAPMFMEAKKYKQDEKNKSMLITLGWFT